MHSMRDFLCFLLGAAASIACIVLVLPPQCPCGGAMPALDPAVSNGGATKLDTTEQGGDDLAPLLRRAAMEDKTILMTFTNEAWTAPGSLLDLFLESFRLGDKTAPLLNHLVIVAVDGKAFDRCRLVHPLCYSVSVAAADLSPEQPFMSKDYLEMMWFRNKFQTRVLELGYSFFFTDMDVVWFRNPLLRVPVGADITIASDQFYGEDPYDVWKNANGGLLYARARRRTAAFFRSWQEEGRSSFPGKNEQYVFDKVKDELSRRHGAAVHFVDTADFGGFCQPKMDFRRLCTFHANCVPGLAKKLEALRGVLGEWKQFRAARSGNTTAN